MKAYGRVAVYIYIFSTSARDGGVISFTSRPPYHQYPLYTRLGGPQSRSGGCGENSWPYRDSNTDSSVVQAVASSYTDCAIQALKEGLWKMKTLHQHILYLLPASCWFLAWIILLRRNVGWGYIPDPELFRISCVGADSRNKNSPIQV
jgi:hypothetical protein